MNTITVLLLFTLNASLGTEPPRHIRVFDSYEECIFVKKELTSRLWKELKDNNAFFYCKENKE